MRVPNSAARRTIEYEDRRKQEELLKAQRAELAAMRKAEREKKIVESLQKQRVTAERVYTTHCTRFCVVLAEARAEVEAVVEYRPYEPKASRYLLRIQKRGKTAFYTFSKYQDCTAFLQQFNIKKIKRYNDISALWVSEHCRESQKCTS